jgi:hypothetical protein
LKLIGLLLDVVNFAHLRMVARCVARIIHHTENPHQWDVCPNEVETFGQECSRASLGQIVGWRVNACGDTPGQEVGTFSTVTAEFRFDPAQEDRSATLQAFSAVAMETGVFPAFVLEFSTAQVCEIAPQASILGYSILRLHWKSQQSQVDAFDESGVEGAREPKRFEPVGEARQVAQAHASLDERKLAATIGFANGFYQT